MSISKKLLPWYRKNGRDLPWRHTTDPYHILVSEMMLQQTQVPRVLQFYDAWLKRFPDWKVLARATNAQVLKAWAGLGYNRRALTLRDIARQVVKSGIPETYDDWLALKGIGPYTAAALSVFSLRLRHLPIDTNIRRVLGRVYLGKPYPQISDDKKLLKTSEALLSGKQFFDIPQALFDLATITCTKTPACEACPLKDECKAAQKFLSGRVRTPKRMIKKSNERIHRNKKYPDRIYRGRILKLVREESNVAMKDIGERIDVTFDEKLDNDWLLDMLARMERDKMIKRNRNTIKLC